MPGSKNTIVHWILFLAISVIWGSSFILIKEGMKTLSPYQVAALRILSGGLVLVPLALREFRKVPAGKWSYIIISGFLGSFFPAFLFCVAETKIDSSLAGFLNALTPVMTIVIGAMFFQSRLAIKRIIGVLIAFVGMLLLFLAGREMNLSGIAYGGFVLMATVCYGVNVNLVARYLKDVGSVNIASISFLFLVPPSFIVLIVTGYFQLPLSQTSFLRSTAAGLTLGVMSSAVATILFYVLIKRAGALFASMVTYGIPFIALGWGLLAGEPVTALHIVGLTIILSGVYIANRS